MACPPESELQGWLQRSLLPTDEERVEAHLDQCDVCRRATALYARVLRDGEVSTTSAPPSPERASPRSTELIRGDVVGRYIVLGPLGAGGMGTVYDAFDPELGRRVALKLLHPAREGEDRPAGQARLLREAHAMARLSHPNVVAIYDMGSLGERVWLALERVEGQTLRAWLNASSRPWREVVATLVQAGRGLLAAHRAGLVHRDFKPENVLVGHDGRARVTDFGLAKVSGDEAEPPALPAIETNVTSLSTVTRAGQLVGTPAYMAPELSRGSPADARSDQYAFCVTLYESLYGVRPYASGGEAASRNEPREPKLRPKVSRAVHAAVLRGLSADPAQRFPSMAELLETLERGASPRGRRLWVQLGLVAATALAAAAAFAALEQRRLLCSGGSSRVAETWNESRKAKIAAAFGRSGHPSAEADFRRASTLLDAYASKWAREHQEACEATRLRGEQSEQVLTLRMACLSSRLLELDALASLFEQGEREVVGNAVKAAHALTPLLACSDVEVLRAGPVAKGGATDEQLAPVRASLAKAKALYDSARYAEASAVLSDAVASARKIGHRPTEAESLELLGAVQFKAGSLRESEQTLQLASEAAEAGAHDAVRAAALTRLASALVAQDRYDEADAVVRRGWAVLERLGGGNPLARANLLNAQGWLANRRKAGRFGIEQFEEVLEIRMRVLGPDHVDVAHAQNNIGTAYIEQGDLARAQEWFERALATYQTSLGPEHRDTVIAVFNLGAVASDRGDGERARQLFQRTIDVAERINPNHPLIADSLQAMANADINEGEYARAASFARRAAKAHEVASGPDSRGLSLALESLGNALTGLGRFEEADATFERAIAMRARATGADSPTMGTLYLNYGDCLLEWGKLDRAQAQLERGRRILEATYGPEHEATGVALEVKGWLLLRQGRHESALPLFERALEVRRKHGADRPSMARTFAALARVQLELGRSAEALANARRSVELLGRGKVPAAIQAEARYALALAIWQTGGDRTEARALAESAARAFEDAARPARAKEVSAWLAKARK